MEIQVSESYYLTRNGMWVTIVGDKDWSPFCKDEPYPFIGTVFDPYRDMVLQSYSKKEARTYTFDRKGSCKESNKLDIIDRLT